MPTEYLILNVTRRIMENWYNGETFPTAQDVADMSIDACNRDTIQLVKRSYELHEETRRFAATVNGYGKVLIRHNEQDTVIETRVIRYSRKLGWFYE